MNWRPVDCHAHSTFSDGALSVAQVVDRAAERGVQAGIADHVSHDVARTIGDVAKLTAYLDALDQHDVLRGGEFCYHDSFWREVPPDLVPRFTHRVGSIHAVRVADGTLVRAFSRRLPDDLDADRYMDAHLDYVESFAREMPVDIHAHPTLVPLPFRHHPAEELWTEEREERLVNALFNAGIAFEISNRYPPHERLVRRAVDRGVRISLGSDGHTAEQVADVARPLEMARALGVREADLYDPRRHGSRTGAFE